MEYFVLSTLILPYYWLFFSIVYNKDRPLSAMLIRAAGFFLLALLLTGIIWMVWEISLVFVAFFFIPISLYIMSPLLTLLGMVWCLKLRANLEGIRSEDPKEKKEFYAYLAILFLSLVKCGGIWAVGLVELILNGTKIHHLVDPKTHSFVPAENQTL